MKSFNKTKTQIIDKKIITSLLFGVITGLAVITVLTLLTSFVFMISGKYPADITKYIVLVFLLAGGLAGGYVCVRINKSSGLALGSVTGLIIFLIILIIGLCSSTGTITIQTLYKFIVLVLFSALGGVLGANKKNNIKI